LILREFHVRARSRKFVDSRMF